MSNHMKIARDFAIADNFYVSSSGYKGASAERLENIFMKSYGNADLGQGVLE